MEWVSSDKPVLISHVSGHMGVIHAGKQDAIRENRVVETTKEGRTLYKYLESR